MPNNTLILLSGRARSGKDTSAEHLIRELGAQYSVRPYAFANEIKDLCIRILGCNKSSMYGDDEERNSPTHIRWTDLPLSREEINNISKQGEYLTGRELMQIIGTNIFRRMYQDCWCRSVFEKITQSNQTQYHLYSGGHSSTSIINIITDVRFANEIDYFKVMNNVILIRFMRNPLNLQHESERDLDHYNWLSHPNSIIINNQNMSLLEKNDAVLEAVKLKLLTLHI